MPLDEETAAAVKVAVREEIARIGLVEQSHHDGHKGAVASKLRTLELLIASKSSGSGGVNTHEVVHSILDERLAQLPAITQQLPPDVPTRAEVRELVSRTVAALPRPTTQIAGAAAGLGERDVNRMIDSALAGLQAYIQTMAQQTQAQAEHALREMFVTFARVETATRAMMEDGQAERAIMEREAAVAGVSVDDYIAGVHEQWSAFRQAALSTGTH